MRSRAPGAGTTGASRARCGSAQPASRPRGRRLRSRPADDCDRSGSAGTATSSAQASTQSASSGPTSPTATSSCIWSPPTTAGRARGFPTARSGTPRPLRARTSVARGARPAASPVFRRGTGRGALPGSRRSSRRPTQPSRAGREMHRHEGVARRPGQSGRGARLRRACAPCVARRRANPDRIRERARRRGAVRRPRCDAAPRRRRSVAARACGGSAARAPPVRGRRPRLVVPLGAQPWE